MQFNNPASTKNENKKYDNERDRSHSRTRTRSRPSRLGRTSAGYSFTPIAFLDNAAPGGGKFTFDFEPSAINNRGEVGFTADVTTGGEGVFVGVRGQLAQIMRSGQPAPGGSVFGPTEFGRLGVNEGGDIAIPFSLEPLDFGSPALKPVFRFSHSTQTLSRVVGPGTPVPGGEHLAGVFFNTAINNRGDIVFSGIVTGGDIILPRHQAR